MSVDYDKELDVTTVRVGPVGETNEIARLSASFECSGKEMCVPADIQLVLVAENRVPRFAEDHALTLVAGDRTLPFPDTWYQAKKRQGAAGVLEFLIVQVPSSDFLALASAGRVEWKAGREASWLTQAQLAALRDVAARIEKAREAESAGR